MDTFPQSGILFSDNDIKFKISIPTAVYHCFMKEAIKKIWA